MILGVTGKQPMFAASRWEQLATIKFYCFTEQFLFLIPIIRLFADFTGSLKIFIVGTDRQFTIDTIPICRGYDQFLIGEQTEGSTETVKQGAEFSGGVGVICIWPECIGKLPSCFYADSS